MIVTIDEARVSYPSIKLDGMELSGMIRSYTLRHAVDEAPHSGAGAFTRH